MMQRLALVVAVVFPQWSWYVSVVSLLVVVLVTIRYLSTMDLKSARSFASTLNIRELLSEMGIITNHENPSAPCTLYAISLVWPHASDGGNGGGYETMRLMQTIEQTLHDDPSARFHVHLHGALPSRVRHVIASEIYSIYKNMAGCVPTSKNVDIIACDANAPQAWPSVCALVSLFDTHSPNATVVVGGFTNSHSMGELSLRLAFQPCATPSRDRGVKYAPEPVLVADTTPQENEHGITWRAVATGCRTTPTFRMLLQNAKALSFAEHAAACMRLYDNTPVHGLADLVLEQYMTDAHSENLMHISLMRAHAELEATVPAPPSAINATTDALSILTHEGVYYTYTPPTDNEPMVYATMQQSRYEARCRPLRWRMLAPRRRRTSLTRN